MMNANQTRTFIKNFLIILRCFIFSIFHGKADRKVLTPRSVVIIQRGKFGDMIVTTAMFRAIKGAYPHCRVTVVGDAVNKKVLDGNPDVDNYILWSDHLEVMISRLQSDYYDFGCITGPNFYPLAALYLGGVKTIVAPVISNGWSPYETVSYKIIRRLVILKEHRMRSYVPREYLRLLEPISINTTNTKKYIYWTSRGEDKAKEIISKINRPYEWLVGIMPGAGNKVKQWPAERFGQIADYLIEKYNAHILIIGNESNRKEIDEMLTAVRKREGVTDTSFTSIDEVKALIPRLDFTVSVDTGPVFIAEASGVPTIDIAGSIHPDEMAPNDGDKHLVVVSEGEPLILTMNARVFDREMARDQIEAISLEMVIKVVDELIQKIKNSKT